jgi:hypothetical protein
LVGEPDDRQHQLDAVVALFWRDPSDPEWDADVLGGRQHRQQYDDEPTGQLDRQTGRQIMRLLQAVVESEGVTALVATHDPAILDLADSVLHLVDGKITA